MNNKKAFVMLFLVIAFMMGIVKSDKVVASSNNLALGQPTFASGNEVDWLVPENAVDGDPKTRWSSAAEDDQWFYVDLGEIKKIARVVINWQTPANTYKILVSSDHENWSNVTVGDGILTAKGPGNEAIEFEQKEARYVKFQGVERRPVEGVLYGYSFFEFEVYEERDVLPEIMQEVKEAITIEKDQENVVLPSIREGYKLTLLGTDSLPVIDKEGNIHTPLVDVDVHLLLQIESESDPNEKITDNVLVTVPGEYTQSGDENAVPRVIPSLREWLGRTGDFVLTEESRIVINPADQAALQHAAETTKQDLEDLTKLNLEIEYGAPRSGDIYLSIDTALSNLGVEGYILDINEYASITSTDITGVFYGTRTILQILSHDTEHIRMPMGITRDYPKYEDRGFMLDVARKFYTIDFLQDYVKLMSYYKMNRFQIHLNDDVGTPFANGKKAAFRLESERYPGLASQDGFYTKDEFRELQRLGMAYGVNVVPEIDTPGHSGVFIDYDPSLGEGKQLDITRPETIAFVKGLFDEYIDGDNPTFIGPDVHIGMDEYFGSDKEAFRQYMDTLINHINGKGKHARVWGGLSQYDGNTPISNEATMDIWYEPYGSAKQAAELGYDIINVNTNLLYIVPQLYRNYLNYDYIYNKWEPIDWIENVLPYGHPKVKGGMFALWNDISVEKGVSMADSHRRILLSMQVLSEKMWSGTRSDKNFQLFLSEAAQYGDPPNVNLAHKVDVKNQENKVIEYSFEDGFSDTSGNGYDAADHNVKLTEGIFGEGAKLNGGASYIQTPLRSLGFGWTLSMWIKPDADNPSDTVLLESPEGQLKFNMGNSGKIGFTKENYTSVFDYQVPTDKWTHIVLTGDDAGTSIFINGGEYSATLKDGTKLETFVLPVEKIGSTTNAFKGVIDQIVVLNTKLDLQGNLALNKLAESSNPESASYTPDKAVDGKADTRWSSEWVDETWFLVDLGESMEVDKVAISWQTAYGTKYKILVSEDKENWTNVTTTNNGIIDGKGGYEVINFNNTKARYVKFEGVERATIFGYSFEEFGVFSDKNKIGDKRALIDLITGIHDEKLKREKYSEQGWQDLQQALETAGATINQLSASKPVIDTALSVLSKARDMLTIEDELALLKIKDGEVIKSNILLPKKGAYDTTISWSSSNPAYLNVDGQLLKRPAAGQSDLSLVLTATFTKGEALLSKDFRVKIKAETGSPWYPSDPGPGSVTSPGTVPDAKDGKDSKGSKDSKDGKGSKDGKDDKGTDTGQKGAGHDNSTTALRDIAGHWAEGYINQAIQFGFVKGYNGALFRPDKPISREEFVAMLVRALNLEGEGSPLSFKDAKDIQSWARPAIAQALQAGLVSGYEDQTFRPKAQISRSEMAAIIVRAMGISLSDVKELTFKDAAQIPQWAQPYVAAAYQAGVIQGRSEHIFAPEKLATRAEAIVMILRMLSVK
ncbi:discoidin domain-containing protein [Paenibacillus sp. N3/727]|uniref:discoidin domain-containing protein n=1 Tax=Paenibacillus sp. N3/727 TaxID=2925845 RepID=UPI001F538813|nr:discoidin domain-containing protein [Paenibacillus sp. N3/727]UNK20733.1 discoidin domain-containing protein [Paenibacillus sp. N3/727]